MLRRAGGRAHFDVPVGWSPIQESRLSGKPSRSMITLAHLSKNPAFPFRGFDVSVSGIADWLRMASLASSMRRRRFQCCILLGLLVTGGLLVCQEPSDTLRQADADYRAGVAALNRNDLKTARMKFESVVRLEP